MRTQLRVSLVLAGALLTLLSSGRAEALEPPAGPAILTVTGSAVDANRGAYVEEQDLLFEFFDRSFDGAAVFDLAMLEALPSHDVALSSEGWPEPVRVSGPWLKDVLAAAGAAESAAANGISVLALDGFATEIDAADLAARDWLVVLKRDGRPLDLGQRGPLWIVYAPTDGKTAGTADEQRWPWAAFMIEVR